MKSTISMDVEVTVASNKFKSHNEAREYVTDLVHNTLSELGDKTGGIVTDVEMPSHHVKDDSISEQIYQDKCEIQNQLAEIRNQLQAPYFNAKRRWDILDRVIRLEKLQVTLFNNTKILPI